MAILDASAAVTDFSAETRYSGVLGSPSAATFVWAVPGSTLITATGTGFTYNGSNLPTGGTVTSLSFDYSPTNGIPDVTITGLSVPLASLVNASNPAYGQVSFWETVLGGDDTITAPLTQGGRIFGDFFSIVAEPDQITGVYRTGGNDTFTASNTSWTELSYLGNASDHALVGDALLVQGTDTIFNGFPLAIPADLVGGDDTFTLSGYACFNVVGDAQDVRFLGSVHGGNDTIISTVTNDPVSPRTVYYSGDVEVNSGTVTGGNDTITGSDSTSDNFEERIAGDVFNAQAGHVTGGRDTITGGDGNDTISGDVSVLQGGYLTGGKDILYGDFGSDLIAGDVYNATSGISIATLVNMTGGNDTIFGGAGNDVICGDVYNVGNIDATSTIKGGSDTISGGGGNDLIYGDIYGLYESRLNSGGNDTIDGGLGDDFIFGQAGSDTASFASIAAAVTVNLMAGTATGQGSDLLDSIENIIGSSLGDTLTGNLDANRIDGGNGDDLILAQDGNDTVFGGGGRDMIAGGTGRDMMDGGKGGDTFVFSGLDSSGTSSSMRDVILNWDAGDVIDVSAIDARPALGDQAFKVITSGVVGTGEMKIVTQADRVILQFNGDQDTDIDMTIEIRTTMAVTAADFIL